MMEQVTYAMALADRYDLIEPPIGEGSFGAVYLADDRKMPHGCDQGASCELRE